MWCWGERPSSSLGDGTPVSETPRRLPDVTDAVAVDMEGQGCAIERDGDVRCWGRSPVDDVTVVPTPVLHPEVRGRTAP